MDFHSIAHLEWARLRSGCYRYDLSPSGVPPSVAADLDIHGVVDDPSGDGIPPGERPSSLPRTGSSQGYGFSELAELLARIYGVNRRRILLGAGTSMVNFLLMAALLRPEDEVLVEQPTYEPLWEVPRALGMRLRRFARPLDGGFLPDLMEIESLLTANTRLVVLSNLHNPSGVLLPRDFLAGLRDLACRRGFRVLVDEVYLDFALAPGDTPRRLAAATFGPQMVSASSLTKVYGLGGLRAGWAVAEAGLVERAYRIADYLGGADPEPSARLAVSALGRLDELRERSRGLSETGQAVYAEWAAGRNDLEWVAPAGGIIVFLRLPSGVNSWRLTSHLARHHQTLVVPGELFESPGYLRLGLGLPPDDLREGLRRLGRGIDELIQTPC